MQIILIGLQLTVQKPSTALTKERIQILAYGNK